MIALFSTAFAENAQDPARDPLESRFRALAEPQGEGWRIAEADILRAWAQSGSAAMDLLLQRGEAAMDEGDAITAIGHLTALTDHAPGFAEGWRARAEALALTGRSGPALADLWRCLSLEPRHFAALTRLGAILEDTGKDDAALAAYDRSLAIHPHQPEALDGRARILQRKQGVAL
ncbi:tetratricopeptide repeat protein [Paracoccus jiaweipingae]|uniref:tetratricopeptide repeat protein n=1 Tax=unclassified Paracoccus (in: a-proteobacteria) TaxID=2688777 RepID=UPI00378EC8F8